MNQSHNLFDLFATVKPHQRQSSVIKVKPPSYKTSVIKDKPPSNKPPLSYKPTSSKINCCHPNLRRHTNFRRQRSTAVIQTSVVKDQPLSPKPPLSKTILRHTNHRHQRQYSVMDSTKPNESREREEGDRRDERLIAPECRVFGPPCPNTLDWNAAIHQQRLLSTLPSPSSHEKAYTKWLQGHRMEPAWIELNFLERAEWIQFYFDTTTEDLKVTELESEEIQDEYEAEAKEYVQMAQKTIIPSKQAREMEEDTKEPKFYYEDTGAASNASGSTTTDAESSSYGFQPLVPGQMPQQVYYGTGYATGGETSKVPGPVGTLKWPRTQALIEQERGSKKRKLPPGPLTMNQQPAGQSGQFGPPMSQAPVVQSAPSMTQAPLYNQFGPPAQSAPSMSQQTVYNQFPATGPVYLNQHRSPYNEPKKG